jgi:hypothetical protein
VEWNDGIPVVSPYSGLSDINPVHSYTCTEVKPLEGVFLLRLVKSVQNCDRLCGLVVRALGYRSGGPGSIPGTTRKKVVGLERGPLSLVNTTEELLDRKVAASV